MLNKAQVREFSRIEGDHGTMQCASCGISHNSQQMYMDSDRQSQKYKAHYCGSCACMLVVASSDAAERIAGGA